MTVGELKKILDKYDNDIPIMMCMDWTELDDPPPHLQQQWNDELGDVVGLGKQIILLNKHFK